MSTSQEGMIRWLHLKVYVATSQTELGESKTCVAGELWCTKMLMCCISLVLGFDWYTEYSAYQMLMFDV